MPGAERRSGSVARQDGSGKVVHFDLLPGRDQEAARLLVMVAAACGVPTLPLLHRSRCVKAIAEARQLAMYLMHVGLRRDYATVGRYFGRDRTTVAHACARIEDARDDSGFDEHVTRLETALATDSGERRRAAG